MQRTVSKGSLTVDAWGQAIKDFQPGTFTPQVRFLNCPIQETMGVLGRKWTMLILRDIGFRRIDRFNRLLQSVRGLTPRVLSMRLSELEAAGIIQRVETKDSPVMVRWGLTDKGLDILPIIVQLIAYGSKWYPKEVFADKKARKLDELFKPEALRLIRQSAYGGTASHGISQGF